MVESTTKNSSILSAADGTEARLYSTVRPNKSQRISTARRIQLSIDFIYSRGEKEISGRDRKSSRVLPRGAAARVFVELFASVVLCFFRRSMSRSSFSTARRRTGPRRTSIDDRSVRPRAKVDRLLSPVFASAFSLRSRARIIHRY